MKNLSRPNVSSDCSDFFAQKRSLGHSAAPLTKQR